MTGHIAGYDLAEQIGIGGFGAVYKAYQPELERDVAIKVILPEYAAHPDFIRRFEIEAQMIARLEHLHIVPLYDYWRDPGGAYLVMRYLRGGNLRGVLMNQPKLEATRVARLVGQMAAALNAAHLRNVIHRDVKPENILLDEFGNAYLADFNIARDLRFPSTGERFGTAAYAAPEQFTEDIASPQTDLFGLGIITYELLTGALPEQNPLPPVQKERPDLPYEINPILWKATAYSPENRYKDPLTFAEELRRVVGEAPIPQITTVGKITLSSGEQESTTRILPPAPEVKNPYRGLQAFDQADADQFFGREAFADKVVLRLGADHFVAIIGASGSGKSSAVLAGVLPRLRMGALPGSETWFYAVMKAGTAFVALDDALRGVNTGRISYAQLENGEWRAGLPPNSTLVLVIDQFEELFTQHADVKLFLAALLKALKDECIYIVLTLRADFYDRPLSYPDFAPLLSEHTEVILPLSIAEMTQAIEKPAERDQIKYEPGLVARIIEDVRDQPGGLPLLQYALRELFDARIGHLITKKVYEERGGISGALQRRADEIYGGLDATEQAAAREVLLRLVDPFTLTRRRVLLSELGHIRGREAMVKRYVESRLLTLDYDAKTRAPTLEVAHEALIATWDRLKHWIDEAQGELRQRSALTAVAAEWDKAKRDPSYLATGSRLVAFEPLLTSATLTLTEAERSYVLDSVAARQRARRRTQIGITGLAVVALIAVFSAIFAVDGQRRAEGEARISKSRELASGSLSAAEQVDLSLLLSVEALAVHDTYEARNALFTRLTANPLLEGFLYPGAGSLRALSQCGTQTIMAGRGGVAQVLDAGGETLSAAAVRAVAMPINAVACNASQIALAGAGGVIQVFASADRGARVTIDTGTDTEMRALAWHDAILASGGDDGVIRLWDTDTRELIRELRGHTDTVWGLAFALDGSRLYSAGADNVIRVWDLETGDEIGIWEGHTNWVLALALSPDGMLLASGSADNTVRLWDVASGDGQVLRGHTNWIRALAFNADGSRLASGSADTTVRLWDLATGDGQVLRGQRGAVWSVLFAGDTLYSAGEDAYVLRWRAAPATGRQVGAIQAFDLLPDATAAAGIDNLVYVGAPEAVEPRVIDSEYAGLVTAVRYNPAGTVLATGADDGRVRLWDAQTTARLSEFNPNVDVIQQIAYSPDGQRIAVVGGGGAAVFAVDDGAELSRYPSAALSVTFAPDSQTVLVGERSGVIDLWRPDAAVPQTWAGHSDGVMSLTFSPDGASVISTGRDGAVIVWQFATGTALHRLEGHADWVAGAAFSGDGRVLATADHQGVLRLWDTERWLALGEPLPVSDGWLNHLAFHGLTLYAAGQNGWIDPINLETAGLLERACTIAGRNLTADEWTIYFGAEPYAPTCGAES